MKHLYSLTIGLLSAAVVIPANAKVEGVSVPGPYPHTPSQSSATALIVNTRLKAKSYYLYQNGQFTPVDSFSYTYSSGRGGSPEEMDMNDDGVSFDESLRFVYNGSSFVNRLKRTQTYGQNGRVEWLYYNPWNAALSAWKDSIRYAYLYNGSSSQIMHARLDIYSGISSGSSGWTYGNNFMYSNTYSNSGYILAIYTVNQNIEFAYDNNDNLICRKIAESDPNTLLHYTIKDSFSYDASGRVNYVLHQVYNVVNATWVNDQQTFYTYAGVTGNDLDNAQVEKWSVSLSGWQKKEQHLFAYDAGHNKISDVTQNWNSGQGAYANSSRIDWTYNYNHQVTSLATTTWSTSAGSWVPVAGNYQRFFYYETYFPTIIKDLGDAVVNMDLFPSPAQDAVHFRIDWRTPQPFSMSVTDMQGRTVQQWDEHATMNYERTLDVSQWPSGNYLLTVSGTNGKATKRFVVAK